MLQYYNLFLPTYIVNFSNKSISIYNRPDNGNDRMIIYTDGNGNIRWDFSHNGKREHIFLFTSLDKMTDYFWIIMKINEIFKEYQIYDEME